MHHPPTTLLLIEPDGDNTALICRLLGTPRGEPYTLTCADSLSAGLEALASGSFDLVLLAIPSRQSPPFTTVARVHDQAPCIPIVLLGHPDHDEPAHLHADLGVQDFLITDRLDGPSLKRAISYAIQRNRARQAICPRHNVVNAVVEGTTDAIFVKDLQGRYLMINAAGARFLGKSIEEVIGRDDTALFSPDTARQIMEEDRRVMAGGVTRTYEETGTAAGVTRAYLSTKGPYRDPDDNVIGLIGISRDVTEPKRVREELIEQRNLLRTLIDNLPDSIFVKDAQGRFVTSNRAHAYLLGATSPDQIVGKTDFDCLPKAVAEQALLDEQEILRTGRPLIDREEPYVDPVGNRRWFSATKVPLRDSRRKIIGLVGMSRDFTERKLAAEQLHCANASLAKREEDLLKALADLQAAQLRLIQAEKLQTIGRLAAGVAHEVKNPLAIIAMGVDYLMTSVPRDNPDVVASLNEMRSAIARADSVVRGLLNYSLPTRLQPTPADLNSVIEQSLSLVKHELLRRHITLTKELADRLPPVRIDPAKMEQAFVNLMLNAAHATPRNGTLTVKTYAHPHAENSSNGHGHVVAEIQDTGTGIPPHQLHRLFEPFYTTKPRGQGNGLGLTVTKTIVELHGGTIDIANRAEGGVRVTIKLKGVASDGYA